MKKHVINAYDNEEQAIEALEQLKAEGYDKDEISLITKDTKKLREKASEVKTTSTDGALSGAAAGGGLGLAGIAIGLPGFMIPGVGAVLVAGPVLAVLGGAAAGAATKEGGLKPALMKQGIPNDDAERYAKSVEDGKILIFYKPKDER